MKKQRYIGYGITATWDDGDIHLQDTEAKLFIPDNILTKINKFVDDCGKEHS